MNGQEIFALLSRWLHIVPAIMLVGGTLMMRFSIVPAFQTTSESGKSSDLREAVRRRWARLVMFSILCLLISGLYNGYLTTKGTKPGGLYVSLLGIKMLLALIVFYFSSVLSGRSKTAQRFRENEIRWLNINIALMLLIVLIAGFMKMSPDSLRYKQLDDISALSNKGVGDASSLSFDTVDKLDSFPTKKARQ